MPKWKLFLTIFIFIASITALEVSVLGYKWAINIVYGCIVLGAIVTVHTMFSKNALVCNVETLEKKE